MRSSQIFIVEGGNYEDEKKSPLNQKSEHSILKGGPVVGLAWRVFAGLFEILISYEGEGVRSGRRWIVMRDTEYRVYRCVTTGKLIDLCVILTGAS